MARRCKDCEPDSKRDAPYPGPRCATHWRAEKQRRKALAHARHVSSTYGLTAEEYQELYDAQGGVCAICRRATGKTRRLSVDHDHQTGKVRGLLCRPCNKLLGHGRDDPAFFCRAVGYLKAPPAGLLGLDHVVPRP